METDKVLALAKEAEIAVGLTGGNPSKDKITRFAALLQQQMEADGWRQCSVGQGTTQFCGIAEELRKDAERQWVGLTDDEVYNALPGYPIDYKLEFYRAIEAKLKEKNG